MTKTNQDFEIPLKKTVFYRIFEILPGALSLTAIALAFIFSAVNPLWGVIYVLSVIIIVFIKGLSMIGNSWLGFRAMRQAMAVDWHQRLCDLDASQAFHNDMTEYHYKDHLQNILNYQNYPKLYPRVNNIYQLIIIAAYNETADVLEPTIQSLINSSFDKSRMIICLAYEERGGVAMRRTAGAISRKYKDYFYDFVAVEHPQGVPHEIIGKGSNISFAGRNMSQYLRQHKIKSEDVIATTLDADNRPHQAYFDYITYEFVTRLNRQNLVFQPVALFLNNIWDTPAPVRVSAAGDSIFNTVNTARIHKIRNFAAHSQPMATLEKMNFWSSRTIVEDGHQYWRSFFFLKGQYDIIPIRVPIYQDAVLSSRYYKTLLARFVQVRRWAYGASDVPYVAEMIRRHYRSMPRAETIFKFLDLLEGHVAWSSTAVVVLLGGWIPLIFGRGDNVFIHQLPLTISVIQTIAVVGIVSTIILFFQTLPIRPSRYSSRRNWSMWLQWVIYPITAFIYGSAAAFYSQMRLMLGKYLIKFDVTDKNTVIKDQY